MRTCVRTRRLRKLQGELLREVQSFAANSGFDLIIYDGVAFTRATRSISPIRFWKS